jgi:hypothetical protein
LVKNEKEVKYLRWLFGLPQTEELFYHGDETFYYHLLNIEAKEWLLFRWEDFFR